MRVNANTFKPRQELEQKEEERKLNSELSKQQQHEAMTEVQNVRYEEVLVTLLCALSTSDIHGLPAKHITSYVGNEQLLTNNGGTTIFPYSMCNSLQILNVVIDNTIQIDLCPLQNVLIAALPPGLWDGERLVLKHKSPRNDASRIMLRKRYPHHSGKGLLFSVTDRLLYIIDVYSEEIKSKSGDILDNIASTDRGSCRKTNLHFELGFNDKTLVAFNKEGEQLDKVDIDGCPLSWACIVPDKILGEKNPIYLEMKRNVIR